MKNLLFIALIASLAIIAIGQPVRAEMATMDEALNVTKNWVTLIIHKRGSWGGSKMAEVQEIKEFKVGDRVLGYFCRIRPQGFIIISLHKELIPVKAFSETAVIVGEVDKGMIDFIKKGMERTINGVEKKIGPINLAKPQALLDHLETDYRPFWNELNCDGETFKSYLQSGIQSMNYRGNDWNDWLLSSSWQQEHPYNLSAPDAGSACTDPRYNGRCPIGCGAIAAGQIMYYWSWPPDIDWLNMRDSIINSPQYQIDAVAIFLKGVGDHIGSNYCSDGCTTNSCFAFCPGEDILDAFEDHYYYSSNADWYMRQVRTKAEWFDIMKSDLNLNRPIPYHITDHHIVIDGWFEAGSEHWPYYHVNYGWGLNFDCVVGCNFWYPVDDIYESDENDEILIANLYPNVALGASLSGQYPLASSPYRYFDQDAVGSNVTFLEGQNLQFLPGITVTCNGTTGAIIFLGSSNSGGITRMFSIKNGVKKSINIYDGHINLSNGGWLKFHK
jgi:hypothetical protein